DIDAGKVSTSFTAPGNGTEFVATAQVSDAAGNKSNVAEDKATLKLDEPGAPVVTIVEDKNNDGYINADELDGDINVSVELPKGAVAGDTLTVTDNAGNEQKVVLTPEQIAAGKVEVTLPAPQDGGKIEVSATVTDVAGNTGPAGTDSATVDTTVYKGLVIEITEDANNDGYINAAELKGNDIDVRVTLPEGAAAGDTLTVSGSGNTDKVITLTPEQVKAGYVDVKFNPTGDNTDFVATASIRD
ncbi:hypothetical protein PL75_10820, partial [Neisseria arctica]